MMRRLILAAIGTAAALGGCSSGGPAAPAEAGVCWHLAQLNDGKYRFNQLAANQPNLENCAAQLEIMRQRFNRLGAHEDQVVGGYQGQFLFIDSRGVFTARNLSSTRYLALVRTGDGRLAVPGAVRQQ